MDEKTIKEIIISRSAEIARTLFMGDRVDLTPVKDGVRIFRIRREEVKK